MFVFCLEPFMGILHHFYGFSQWYFSKINTGVIALSLFSRNIWTAEKKGFQDRKMKRLEWARINYRQVSYNPHSALAFFKPNIWARLAFFEKKRHILDGYIWAKLFIFDDSVHKCRNLTLRCGMWAITVQWINFSRRGVFLLWTRLLRSSLTSQVLRLKSRANSGKFELFRVGCLVKFSEIVRFWAAKLPRRYHR